MNTCLKNSFEMQELIDIISCIILMQMEKNPSEHDDRSSGGIYLLPSNSTTKSFFLLSATINFIGCWLQALEKHFYDAVICIFLI